MLYILLALVCFSYIYSLYVHFFSLKAEKAKMLCAIQFVSTWAGALFCVSAFILYYSSLGTLDNDALITAAGNAFYVFATPTLIFSAFVIALTVSIHYLSGKMQAVNYSVSHLSSILILLYTMLCAVWSHYDEIDLAIHVYLLGAGLALLCLIPCSLQMRRRAVLLSDKQYVESVLEKRGLKKHKRQEIIRSNQKRKNLKKGKKLNK